MTEMSEHKDSEKLHYCLFRTDVSLLLGGGASQNDELNKENCRRCGVIENTAKGKPPRRFCLNH